MSSFIKVIEIWTPVPGKPVLKLADGFYGRYVEFKRISEQYTFNYDEGLPGKAWSNACPQIITDLEHSYFLRKEPAARAGLNAGIAMPLFAGEFLTAVVVFLCGEINDTTGAIELWGKREKNSNELSLKQGYYGPLKKLEQASQQTQFAKGNGLPGSVWDYRIPMVVENMARTRLFKRAGTAVMEGITAAIGLPFNYYTDKEFVLTFLSAHRTPIAQRFEIWIPDREQNHLFFHAGLCEQGEDIVSMHKYTQIERGVGLLGKVWLTGVPTISNDLVADGLGYKGLITGMNTGFVMPIIEEGFLKSVVVFLF